MPRSGSRVRVSFPAPISLQIQYLSPKFTNPVSQYNHCHIQLVEHYPRLPRLGSRVRVSFPAPISLQIQYLSPKFTNPVYQYNHCHIQLVEHDPRLPRLGSRVRVSFPAPISLRSPHHPFELPITSRCDDLPYPAFSQVRILFSVSVSYLGAGEGGGGFGQADDRGGEGETAGKKIGGAKAPPTGSLARA